MIAENYSRIFPPDSERTEFVKSFLNPGEKVLDTGCATGDLCIELAVRGFEVYGIDLNDKMIEIAKDKSEACNVKVNFKVLDMMSIKEKYKKNYFSAITCFGNTLPHLKSENEIADFFKQVYSLIRDGGAFIFQILNYDKILKERACNFPVIKNQSFTFKRKYDFKGDFTKFTISLDIYGKTYTDSTILFPVKKETAVSLLKNAGFTDINCYSGYSKTHSSGKEFATIFMAIKV